MMLHLKENSKKAMLLKVMIAIIVVITIIATIVTSNQVYGNEQDNFGLVFSFIVLLIVVMIVLLTRGIFKEIKLSSVYLLLIIPIGIIYTLLIPPGIVPDEWLHMQNVLDLSSQIIGLEDNDKIVIRETENELYSKQITTVDRTYYQYIYDNINTVGVSNDYVETAVTRTNFSQIFGYFPAVIGVLISRLFHFGGVLTIYVARTFNFTFYIVLTYFALKKLPFGKLAMFTVLMLPMSCQQMYSVSYDVIINSAAAFCIAYGMFFVYQANKAKISDLFVYGLSSILLLTIKGSAYAFILIIPVLARYFNPNNENIATKIKLIIFFILVITILLLNYNAITSSNNISTVESVSQSVVPWSGTPSYTLSYFISNIPETIKLFFNTFIEKGAWYVDSAIGSQLGWLNILMPGWIISCWKVLLVASAFTEKIDREILTIRHRIIYLFIAVVIILVVMLAMALAWTPIGYGYIEGVQGRYYIPIILFLLILFYNKKFYLNEYLNKILVGLTIIMSELTIFQLISIIFV